MHAWLDLIDENTEFTISHHQSFKTFLCHEVAQFWYDCINNATVTTVIT